MYPRMRDYEYFENKDKEKSNPHNQKVKNAVTQ